MHAQQASHPDGQRRQCEREELGKSRSPFDARQGHPRIFGAALRAAIAFDSTPLARETVQTTRPVSAGIAKARFGVTRDPHL